jgi:hypothetical protein
MSVCLCVLCVCVLCVCARGCRFCFGTLSRILTTEMCLFGCGRCDGDGGGGSYFCPETESWGRALLVRTERTDPYVERNLPVRAVSQSAHAQAVRVQQALLVLCGELSIVAVLEISCKVAGQVQVSVGGTSLDEAYLQYAFRLPDSKPVSISQHSWTNTPTRSCSPAAAGQARR